MRLGLPTLLLLSALFAASCKSSGGGNDGGNPNPACIGLGEVDCRAKVDTCNWNNTVSPARCDQKVGDGCGVFGTLEQCRNYAQCMWDAGTNRCATVTNSPSVQACGAYTSQGTCDTTRCMWDTTRSLCMERTGSSSTNLCNLFTTPALCTGSNFASYCQWDGARCSSRPGAMPLTCETVPESLCEQLSPHCMRNANRQCVTATGQIGGGGITNGNPALMQTCGQYPDRTSCNNISPYCIWAKTGNQNPMCMTGAQFCSSQNYSTANACQTYSVPNATSPTGVVVPVALCKISTTLRSPNGQQSCEAIGTCLGADSSACSKLSTQCQFVNGTCTNR